MLGTQNMPWRCKGIRIKDSDALGLGAWSILSLCWVKAVSQPSPAQRYTDPALLSDEILVSLDSCINSCCLDFEVSGTTKCGFEEHDTVAIRMRVFFFFSFHRWEKQAADVGNSHYHAGSSTFWFCSWFYWWSHQSVFIWCLLSSG